VTLHNYEEKANAGEFVKMLIDAILDDASLEKDSPNPLYELKKSTLEAYYAADCALHKRKPLPLLRELMRQNLLISWIHTPLMR